MTRPLTGYEKEIAILHAEANQTGELLEEFKVIANEYKQAVERVRELHKGNGAGMCLECMPDGLITMPCSTIQALDGNSEA